MKRLLIPISLLAVFVLTAWSSAQNATIQPNSSLWVEGTSSLHDWKMTAKNFAGVVDLAETGNVNTVQVTVPVLELSADNGTMNKKAYEALKAKEYPTITYTLDASDLTQKGDNFELNTNGSLTMAGVTKPVTFTVKGEKLSEGTYRYMGSTPLVMSEFGIDPPRAMLGTLKTGDKVVVHFNVVVSR